MCNCLKLNIAYMDSYTQKRPIKCSSVLRYYCCKVNFTLMFVLNLQLRIEVTSSKIISFPIKMDITCQSLISTDWLKEWLKSYSNIPIQCPIKAVSICIVMCSCTKCYPTLMLYELHLAPCLPSTLRRIVLSSDN